jgi:hypothetical protein
LPYDDELGGHWLLTVDEFTSSNSGQDINGVWIPSLWEDFDFYFPKIGVETAPFYRYYNGSLVDSSAWGVFTIRGWIPNEHTPDRCNYLQRTHPKYPGVDPLRLQGAFLRIWDRDSLGTNDTTANDKRMLVNAYDVQENDSHPEGYVGLENIPEVSDVPTGLHEPYLVGNTLYLAGYNTGARILKLIGDSIAVRAYCRTEHYVSNDPASEYLS